MKTILTRRHFLQTSSLGAVGGALGVTAAALAAPAAKTGDAAKPAILGGAPTHSGGWPKWPQWDPADDTTIEDVMKKGVWSRAKLVTEFENQWAKPTTSTGHTIARTGYTGASTGTLHPS